MFGMLCWYNAVVKPFMPQERASVRYKSYTCDYAECQQRGNGPGEAVCTGHPLDKDGNEIERLPKHIAEDSSKDRILALAAKRRARGEISDVTLGEIVRTVEAL